jgi:hypothetical protein
MKKFKISYEMETVLDVDSLWPDGDAPEDPTVEDVKRLIIKHGGIYHVLNSWNLHRHDSDWYVTAHDNGATK